MFTNVLFATDLSEASTHLMECAHELRDLGTERASLLYCLGIRHLEEMQYLLTPLVVPHLRAQKELLEKEGFQVTTEIAAGLPQLEVGRIAAEKRSSLVVIGTHGRTMSDEIRLGGVASELIHTSRIPILLIRLKISTLREVRSCELACHDLLGHVLFPTDFSENAERAFEVVEELSHHGAKRVTLLHVQDQTKIEAHLKQRLEEFNGIDRDRLESLRRRLDRNGRGQVDCEISYGSPVAEILKRARGGEISLIVMGSQGKGYISEVFLGSVSHRVARHAETSVLLVPAAR